MFCKARVQSAAMEAKKIAGRRQNNSVCQTNMSPGCYISVKFRIQKHCLAKHFS